MSNALELLFVSLWFVSGMAGFHITCAASVASGVDERDDYKCVWASLMGPSLLLAALIICVREACTKSEEE